jgi:hypothetical protein
VSHILSGRNNPSLDFVLKMLQKYKYLSTEWLLFGKGSMYKDDSGMQSLFDQDLKETELKSDRSMQQSIYQSEVPENPMDVTRQEHNEEDSPVAVNKIVWFYSDGTFLEYRPRR